MKRIVSVLLSLAILLGISGLSTISAFAEVGLDVTSEGAYIVRNAADFKQILNDLTATYEIWGNIDLRGENNVDIGTSENPFTGKIIGNLNGEGKKPTIALEKTGTSNLGLVNYLGAGEISNLKLKGNITGGSVMGSAAGTVVGAAKDSYIDNYAVITSTSTDATVANSVTGNIGGIIGSVGAFAANISYCNNYVTVAPASLYSNNINTIGGIIGSTGNENIKVSYCYNYGEVKGKQFVGGIVGSTGSSSKAATITSCANFGNIGGGTGSKYTQVGGIIGAGFGTISKCYNTGDILTGIYVGGIAGTSSSTSARVLTITDCFNIGNTRGTNGSYDQYIGIAASLKGGTFTIKNTYNLTNTTEPNIYPLTDNVTYTNSITFTNNYYLDKGKTVAAFAVNGSKDETVIAEYLPTALTAEQMTEEESFDGFDFEDADAVWAIKAGYDYPQLIDNPYKELIDISTATIELQESYNADDGSYSVIWEEVEGATEYQVVLNDGESDIKTETITTNSYTLSDVAYGKTYTVKVKAINEISETEFSEISIEVKASVLLDKTSDGAYIVRNAADFKQILNDLTATYEIWGNIDLTGDNNVDIGTAEAPFTGKIKGNLNGEGNKPTITLEKTGTSNLGLVNYLGAGEISNLKLKGNITGDSVMGSAAGSVVGAAKVSYIDNYAVITSTSTDATDTNSVTGNIGGIIGSVGDYNAEISYCNNYASVAPCSLYRNNINRVGGIIGGTGNASIKLSFCYNYGEVKGKQFVGGIVGQTGNTISITDCANYGEIGGGTGSRYTQIGGIIGSGFGTISRCYNTGNILGGQSIGGISGTSSSTSARVLTITDCFNTANTRGINTDPRQYVGIVGTVKGGTITIKNTYNLLNTNEERIYPLAISITYSNAIDIANNYYLDTGKEVTDFAFTPPVADVLVNEYLPIGLSKEQMVQEESFDGFDFDGEDAVWEIKEGFDYPQLISNPYREIVDLSTATIDLQENYNINNDSYSVSWKKLDGATGYHVVLNDGEADVATEIITGDSYELSDIVYGKTYTVKVKAVNETEESEFSEISISTLYAGGDGESEETAFEIANARHFANIGETGFYKQIADIETITTPKATFNGTYDGNNKYIKVNLSGNTGYIALFAETDGAKISNLTIKGNVTASEGASGAAALIGKDTNSTVTGCINEALVNSASVKTGGFVAETATTSAGIFTITDSTNKGNVTYTGETESTSGMGIGGIIGVGGIKNASNVINEGTVTGGAGNTGGIIGYSARTLKMSICANKGKVISNGASVGGIAGRLANSGYHIIDKCYNSGPVTANGVAGGIVANSSMDLTLTNCFNTAKIIGTGYVGSIIGSFSEGNNQRTLTASNCYDIANSDKEIIDNIDATTADISNLYILTEKDLTDYNGSPKAFTAENQLALLAVDGWVKLNGYDYPQLSGIAYEKIYYVIQIKLSAGGQADTDDVIYVTENEEVEITITPDEDYEIKEFTFNGVTVEDAIGKAEAYVYKTPSITEDSLIVVSFKKNSVLPSITNVYKYEDSLSVIKDLYTLSGYNFIGKAGALLAVTIDEGYGYTISECGMLLSETAEDYLNGEKIKAEMKDKAFATLVFGANAGKKVFLTPYILCDGEPVYGTPIEVELKSFVFYE